ncbi:MAG TPA: hypothetical protein VF457_15920 [Burkholderiaceae bacterium]
MAVNYLPFESEPIHLRRGTRWQRVALFAGIAWFLLGGLGHLLLTDGLVRIVPPAVPDARDVVLITGLLEILGALGLLLPWTRRLAGWCLVAYTLAVTPVHLYMLHAHDEFPALPVWLLWARLGFQAVVLWAIAWGSRWRAPRRRY